MSIVNRDTYLPIPYGLHPYDIVKRVYSPSRAVQHHPLNLNHEPFPPFPNLIAERLNSSNPFVCPYKACMQSVFLSRFLLLSPFLPFSLCLSLSASLHLTQHSFAIRLFLSPCFSLFLFPFLSISPFPTFFLHLSPSPFLSPSPPFRLFLHISLTSLFLSLPTSLSSASFFFSVFLLNSTSLSHSV
ncbi:hypothetical protein B0H66DRAFT_120923 [Apodospora peruviana]|uniref:Uncharacterized protein n=1 Tax=Apodospora peruviana TaxID=516989 RepID=A0AAE0MAG2_9PEZI|nr:hypothetical protein B0H66DRAFT_120923 [Apodospora peruviana]